MRAASTDIIVVDFDGTLISRDLGDGFCRWLIGKGLASPWGGLIGVPLGAINWTLRKLFEIPFCNRILIGLPDSKLDQLAYQYIEFSRSTTVLNFALLDWLAVTKGKIVLLTACPEFLVSHFLDQNNLQIFDEVIGQRRGRFGWILNPTPFGRFKPKFVNGLITCSIADSKVDRFLLKNSRHSIVIGDNLYMTDLAKKHGWPTCAFGQQIPDFQTHCSP